MSRASIHLRGSGPGNFQPRAKHLLVSFCGCDSFAGCVGVGLDNHGKHHEFHLDALPATQHPISHLDHPCAVVYQRGDKLKRILQKYQRTGNQTLALESRPPRHSSKVSLPLSILPNLLDL